MGKKRVDKPIVRSPHAQSLENKIFQPKILKDKTKYSRKGRKNREKN